MDYNFYNGKIEDCNGLVFSVKTQNNNKSNLFFSLINKDLKNKISVWQCEKSFDEDEEIALKEVMFDFSKYLNVNISKSIYVDTISFENVFESATYVMSVLESVVCDTNFSLPKIYLISKEEINSIIASFRKFNLQPQVCYCAFLTEEKEELRDKFLDYNKKLVQKKPFREHLLSLMEEKGYRILSNKLTQTQKVLLILNGNKATENKKFKELCEKSGMEKSTLSKLISDKTNHTPTRKTIASLCIGLTLNLEEAKELYASAGYNLGTNDPIDIIVRFAIEEEVYDMDILGNVMFDCGLKPLGFISKDELT